MPPFGGKHKELTMALLTKDQIITSNDRESQTVEVPEWGGEVRIMAVTPAVLREVRNTAPKSGTDETFGYRLMVKSIVDENGNPIFTQEDVAALEGKSEAALKRVMEAINELNGWTKKSKEELGNA
jgi:hypothetical protein